MIGDGATVGASTVVVLPCTDLDATLGVFTEQLGFQLDMITPADAPAAAVVSGHGLTIRLDTRASTGAIERRPDAADALDLPPLEEQLEIVPPDDADSAPGRAGMRYRDLLPHRLGGRVIASHIVIPDGGPVADYVHHHHIRFQVIYCVAGWVRVVYEDQGPPFLLQPGDCVLQPPGIRHRVLESSSGAQVVEVGSPAEHETNVDHDLALPTPHRRADRVWGRQRFVHHVADHAAWRPSAVAGFEVRDTGVGAATDGLAGVRVLRRTGGDDVRTSHDGELRFWYALRGSAELDVDDDRHDEITAGTAITVPAGLAVTLRGTSSDLELLEVTVPA